MNFDPANFAQVSVVDTCAVWNMLSSLQLNRAIVRTQLHFCITSVVLYECLHKTRPHITAEQQIMIDRLISEREKGRFPVQECRLEDLLAVSEQTPNRLGAGELSCIAAAYGIRSIAVMTDERLAKRCAHDVLRLNVETTPKLYGYLHFHRYLVDSDHKLVINEHERFERRPLTQFFNETYNEAMRCRLMVNQTPKPTSAQ